MNASDFKTNHQQGSLWKTDRWLSKLLGLVIIILLIPSFLINVWSVIKIFNIAYSAQAVATPPIPALMPASTSARHLDPIFAYAIQKTDIRVGPAVGFKVIGTVKVTDHLSIVGQSPDRRWYRLRNGGWVTAESMELPAGDLLVMDK